MSLRVLVITQGVSRIVEPLITSNHSVVAVIESAPRGAGQGRRALLLRRVMAKVAKLIFSVENLEDYCRSRTIAYRMMYDSKELGLAEWISSFQPDVVVVHSMSQLLRKNIYSLARLGAINLHPSLLSRYRGPNSDCWRYHDVDLAPGATVHCIDDGEDTGDILAQGVISISLGLSSPKRSERLVSELSVGLLLQALDRMAVGTAERLPQPEDSPNARARNLSVEEHGAIIDWQQWPIERIWHVLRGTEQWLNAIEPPKGLFKGQRWSIGDCHREETMRHPAGAVYREHGGYRVACKEGAINLIRTFSVKRLAIHIATQVLKKVAI